MSTGNIDLLKQMIRHFNDGDIPGVLRLMDPQVRFEHRVAELQGDAVGVAAVEEWLTDTARHLQSGRIDCDEFYDLGDRVLALGSLRAVGAASGVDTELPYAVLATFRDGLMTHYVDYGDRQKALAAADPSS